MVNFVTHVSQHLTSDLGKDIDDILTSLQITLNQEDEMACQMAELQPEGHCLARGQGQKTFHEAQKCEVLHLGQKTPCWEGAVEQLPCGRAGSLKFIIWIEASRPALC